MKAKFNTRLLVTISLLVVISYILAFIEISIPLVPSFMKLDVSDLPALLGTFALGPIPAVVIELLKNLLGVFSSSTVGVGELANFIINGSFVYVAGVIYKNNKTKKNAIIACAIATIVRGVVAVFANYYMLFPIYQTFMPIDQLIQTFSELVPFIKTKWDVMIFSVLPFNIVKGAVNCLIAIIVYKRVSPLLKQGAAITNK